jgi:hypothetical protein
MEEEYLKIPFWRFQDSCRFFQDVYQCKFHGKNRKCDINKCPIWKWIKEDQPK